MGSIPAYTVAGRRERAVLTVQCRKVMRREKSSLLMTFDRSRFRRRLLGWFDEHKRVLPWRQDRDPYRVWVSEIMLQQTRVAAVVEHYKRFLRRFPKIEKLARAREASVLAAWSGLGYYRRARMMHAAAKKVVADGSFPVTAAELRELPGIGHREPGKASKPPDGGRTGGPETVGRSCPCDRLVPSRSHALTGR